jgi:SAM-dependent methyltransferase
VNRSTIPKTDYAEIAESYDKLRPTPVNIWLSKITEYGKIGADSAVLDIGCGTGRFPLSMPVARNFCALEPSIEMLRQAVAKDRSKRILWIQGDGQRLPFRDNTFDYVYMTLVIHHIENKKACLQEIYRVLKRGGNCVIMTNSHSRIRKHVLRHFPGVITIDLERFPSIPSLKKLMITVGFRDVHHHAIKLDEGYMSTDRYLDRVRNKYISTLTLLSDDAFQKGLKTFQGRVKRRYGDQMRHVYGFVFVAGQK